MVVKFAKAMIFACVATLAIGALTASVTAEVVKREPGMGQMKENQRLLVDDGSCPAGQIKEVIGGNHQKVGGTKFIERQRRCIPRR
jgi:hypothetical protein